MPLKQITVLGPGNEGLGVPYSFAPQVIAHDIGMMCEHAFTTESYIHHDLLQVFLAVDDQVLRVQPEPTKTTAASPVSTSTRCVGASASRTRSRIATT